MALKKNHGVVGLITHSSNAFFMRRALQGMRPELQRHGFDLRAFEMKSVETAHEYHQFIEQIAEEPIDGVIYGHLRLSPSQVMRFLQKGMNVVGLTERMDGLDWVCVDDFQGGYLGASHLLRQGHRRIAFLNGPPMALEARLREDGFNKALADFGLKPGRGCEVQMLHYTAEEGRSAAHMLLDLPERPTAIFCAAGDIAALGVVDALLDRGISIPQEMSVLGFDDLEFAKMVNPPLSTVRQPLEAMGRMAAHLLIESREATQGEIFAPELINRASTMAPKTLPAQRKFGEVQKQV
jgi:LacI family transcriptional regulator